MSFTKPLLLAGLLLLPAAVGGSSSASSEEVKYSLAAQYEFSSRATYYRHRRVYRRTYIRIRRPFIPYACAAVVFPRSPLCDLVPYYRPYY